MTALLPTYARFDVTIESAKGSIVTDINDKKYLDFTSGIGVLNVGHRNPKVQKAVEDQLNKFWHISNLYHIPIQEEVADKLVKNSSGDSVFFANSGAEANEAAIKLARKATGKTKILTFEQSFHGRTYATMSATGQSKIQEGFGPPLGTFEYLPFNDVAALEAAVNSETAAIMLEVIQGEGGVIPATTEFIQAVQDLAKKHNVLIVVDEIQTGIGRTGKAFGYQSYDLSPDIITSAKGLGNGLPVGAMIAKEHLAEFFGPGSHGSTFGGNPLSLSAVNAVLDIAFTEDFLNEVNDKGAYLQAKLNKEIGSLTGVKEIRGTGLMIGIEHENVVLPYLQELINNGLLVLNAGPNVIRLLPALTVTKEQIDEAIVLLKEVLSDN